MKKFALIGLGKMGISHCAILNAHPDVDLVGVCDASDYVMSVLSKYSGLAPFSDYREMLDRTQPDAVLIATPSKAHAEMVTACLQRGISVFCEKPFTLSAADSDRLTAEASDRGLITQVGYHNRFVAAFAEVKKLLEANAIGTVSHVLGEAYGPVVLKPQGSTWRSQKDEGGGCLYDYAAHVINLVNWYIGAPQSVGGTVLNKVFSRETDDEVASTLRYANGATAQLSVNWSDESQRKMTTRMTLWGTKGRIFADRQECQIYLREGNDLPDGYGPGWNVRYTTELTPEVWYYLRGEEYSAQVADFVERVLTGRTTGVNDFASASETDRTISMMVDDAEGAPDVSLAPPSGRARSKRRRWWQVGQTVGP